MKYEFTLTKYDKYDFYGGYLLKSNENCKDFPTEIFFDREGSLEEKRWHINGKLHREGAPAIIWYFENGKIQKEVWLIENKAHRENGPSETWYNDKGEEIYKYYHINGKELSRDEWLVYNRKRKLNEIRF